MTEKSSLDRALDLFVFAPLGAAMSVRDALPQLAEKGRTQVTTQTTMAKMVGEFAVRMGAQEAQKLVDRAKAQAAPVLGGRAPARPASTPAPAPTTPAQTAPAPTTPAQTAPAPTARPAATAATNGAPLAIPGYDSLSASQVVQRLAGLSRDELEAVRAHEARGRGRKTILHRVDQLQQTSPNGSSSAP